MTREEIINLIFDRMRFHDNKRPLRQVDMTKAFECKQILNRICTPAELRKLQEGGKL